MLTLYDYGFSGNGYKVRLALRELGRPFVYRQVNILAGETHQPWFLEKNPAGQIPVLELPGGEALSESNPILVFLGQGTPLLPDDPMGRQRVLQWLSFEQTWMFPIARARFLRRFPDFRTVLPEEFAGWAAEGARGLDILEGRLAEHPYLVDDCFTVADIGVYAYAHCASEAGHDLARWPAIQRWIGQIEARPAWTSITNTETVDQLA